LKQYDYASFFKGSDGGRELPPSKNILLQGWREVLVLVDAKSIHPRKRAGGVGSLSRVKRWYWQGTSTFENKHTRAERVVMLAGSNR